ncbi:hypothetical protein BJV74DRAFT_798680 [Russula compacta]|nr:hypothetical protein BJV74DRAFT_798680 [Russula compacta]
MDPTASSSSSSNFQSAFSAALQSYEKATKHNLLTHPLAAQLQSCDSPAAILSVLHDLVHKFDERRARDERSRNWLNPTVNVLYTFSATMSAGVSLAFPPANAIFTGIGVLLLAAKDAESSQDMLVDIFARIENFFRRLECYKEVPPTAAMTDMIVKIMVEVFSILAIATTEISQGRRRKFVRKLIGKGDIENALKRLDTLTQDESRMAIAEVLKVTHEIRSLNKAMTQQTMNKADDEKRSIFFLVKQLRKDVRTWLSPPDPSINHNIARSVHHEGTAEWFFQGSLFDEWKSTPCLLWVHGKRSRISSRIRQKHTLVRNLSVVVPHIS